jgi:hypothetical protein
MSEKKASDPKRPDHPNKSSADVQDNSIKPAANRDRVLKLVKRLRRNASKLAIREYLSLFFSAAVAGARVWSVLLVRGQLHVMQGTLDEMRDEQRPEIAIDYAVPVGPFNFTGDQAGMKFNIIVRNIGHRTASFVLPHTGFYLRTSNFGIVEAQQAACNRKMDAWVGDANQGFNLFYGQQMPMLTTAHLSSTDYKKWVAFGKAGTPMIVGCVDYVFDDKHHQTPFVFEVDQVAPTTQKTPVGIQALDVTGAPVPAEALRLMIPPWFASQPT